MLILALYFTRFSSISDRAFGDAQQFVKTDEARLISARFRLFQQQDGVVVVALFQRAHRLADQLSRFVGGGGAAFGRVVRDR